MNTHISLRCPKLNGFREPIGMLPLRRKFAELKKCSTNAVSMLLSTVGTVTRQQTGVWRGREDGVVSLATAMEGAEAEIEVYLLP